MLRKIDKQADSDNEIDIDIPLFGPVPVFTTKPSPSLLKCTKSLKKPIEAQVFIGGHNDNPKQLSDLNVLETDSTYGASNIKVSSLIAFAPKIRKCLDVTISTKTQGSCVSSISYHENAVDYSTIARCSSVAGFDIDRCYFANYQLVEMQNQDEIVTARVFLKRDY